MSTMISHRYGRQLDATDRCDRCSARAVVSTALVAGGELLWCSHHFSLNADALIERGAVVVNDERLAR
jgi:hypothetical protein